MSCLGSDQDHGHVHEQRWLQKQIPLPHVGDLSANSQCKPDAWDLLHGKNTPDGESQKLSLSSQGWGGGCIAPRGQGDTFGLCSRGNAIARLLGATVAAAPLPSPWLPPSPGRELVCILRCHSQRSLARPVCPAQADAFTAAHSALELQLFPGDQGLSKDRGSRVGPELWP